MSVTATYCQICGLPVNHDHYIPSGEGSDFFYIYRGKENNADNLKPLIDFQEHHEWMKDVLGLPLGEPGKIIEGKVSDGILEQENGDSVMLWDGVDECAAVHRACWKLAGSPKFLGHTTSVFPGPIIDEKIKPFGEHQLFDFKGLVDAGYGWMLIDPEIAEGEKNRQRILELAKKVKLYEEADILFKEKKDAKVIQIAKELKDSVIIKKLSERYVQEGDLESAYHLLVDHFNGGGEFNELMTEDFIDICMSASKIEGKDIEAIIDYCIENFEKKAAFRKPRILGNLIYLSTDMERYETIYKATDIYKTNGGEITVEILMNYSYAATITKNKKIIQKLLDQIENEYQDIVNSDNQMLLNMSCMYAIIGDKGNMIKYLELLKNFKTDFDNLKTDEDFKDYWDDEDFQKLFV